MVTGVLKVARTVEITGVDGLSIGGAFREIPETDGFDTFGAFIADIKQKSREWAGSLGAKISAVREHLSVEERVAPVVGVIALDGTIVQMSARDAEAMTRMPARQSTGEAPQQPPDPKKPNPFDRAGAALKQAGETFIQSAQKLWEKTKQGVSSAYEATHRSLGKSAVGPLIEIDAAAIDEAPKAPRQITKEPREKSTFSISRGNASEVVAPRPADEKILDMLAEGFGRRKADGEIDATEKQKEVFLQAFFEVADREEWTQAKRWKKFASYLSIISGRNVSTLPTEGTPREPIPKDIFRVPKPAAPAPELPKEEAETPHIAELEGADYGMIPKLAGETALAAWAAGIRRLREDNEFAEDQSALLDDFLGQMAKWGWNDVAITAAFDMFSDILYPKGQPRADVKEPKPASETPTGRKVIPPRPTQAPTAEERRKRKEAAALAAAGGVGEGGNVPPTTTGRKEPEGWRKWLPLGVAVLTIATIVSIVKSCDTAPTTVPEPGPTTPTTSGPQTPGGEQTPGNPDDTDDNNDEEIPITPQVQTRLKGAEADKKGDFVRMTAYSDRHENREDGDDFSTVWWIAGQQLDAVNGSAKPTVPEVWEFTDQTLKHNKLTWKEARRLQVDQKIRLLSDAVAKQVIETVK